MTSKIVVNNIEADAGISSVTLLSHVAGHDSTQNISGINSVTANAFYGSGANLTGISAGAISSIATDGAARVLTSDGDGTATAHSFVTIENNRLSVNRGTGSGTFPLIVRRTDASGIIAEFANSDGYGLLIGQNSATGEAYLRTGTGQPMVFTTNSGSGITNERMRIHSNGAVSIANTRNYYGALNVEAGVITSGSSAIDIKASGTDVQAISVGDHNTIGAQIRVTNGSKISFGTDTNHPLTFYTGTGRTDRLRINSSGVVQVLSERLTMGTSVTNGGANDGNFCIEFSSASRNAIKLRDTHNLGSTTYMVLVGGSATVGSITGTTGQAFYNNLSDYRSKENDVEITDGIEKIKLLRPIRFNYKVDKDTICDGFFAHEVTPAVPTAVTGEKDAVDSEGKFSPQMLDTGKIIPLLTAALQEAITKIETLEAKVAALEGS